MGTNPARYLLPLLLILPINGTDLSEYGTSSEAREPKSSRRVVRLYSGTRPIPIVCAGEGFQADPNDCSVFHRCMKNGNGRYLSFRFQCGPGTIYDPDAEICNHPERTKRSDCGRNKPIHIPEIEFPFDNDINREIPSPISTIYPINRQTTSNLNLQTTHRADVSTLATKNPWPVTSHQYFQSSSNPFELPTKRQDLKTTKTPPTKRHIGDSFSDSITPSWMSPGNTRLTTPRLINRQTTSQAGDICTSDGFIGDNENCRKFYRCINNQRGGFIRYEFMCNEPTIWDDEKQSCNHAWAVKRRRCGRGSLIDKSEDAMNKKDTKESAMPVHSVSNIDTTQNQLQINYGSKVTQIQTQISNGSATQNQTQINYGQGVPNNTTDPSILQNQTQISHGNAISQTQTQINYGDKAVQTQLQIDHSKESSQSQTQISESTSTTRTTHNQQPHVSSSSNTNNVCTESGFMGDSEDCKKFYRCVDNGRGGFIRYEFTCGEGTVWDSQIEACNHAWAVKECGGKAPQEATTQSTTKITESPAKPTVSSSLSTMSTTTTTQSYYSPTEEETEDDNDIPYGNQPTSSAPSKPPQHETTTAKAPQNVNDNNCKSSGFMGDTSDCKKFYRCVDNGKGGFTRYEFSCGEGTVWDEKIQSCNHPWAVENCGGNTGTSSSTSSVQTTSTQIISQIPPQNDDYDTGYGSQHDEPLESSTTVTTSTMRPSTTTVSQTPPQSTATNTGNDCTSSGFMGDNNDCKKFYRCVDNGNGGYTKYEFSCGEGTVWDPKIQACNHAWAVEKCGGNSAEDINKVETTTQKESTTSLMTSSSTPMTEPDDNDGGYEQPSNEPQPVATTSDHPQDMGSNQCKSSGFMGDSNDCKKFYRCVDNGDGTFTRYEFSCGEGTVWDTKIDACNHAWAVEKCSNTSSQPISSTTQISSTSHETKPDDQGQQTTQKTSTSASSTSKPSDNQCTQEGFYGDKNNCKNFYRCVDNGQGGFTKYEFTCGEGTVWVQDIQACDHEAPDKKCSQHASGTTSSKPYVENDEMLSEPTTTQSTAHSTANSENNYSSQKPQSSNDKCESEGFYGDSNDCKKFYRCVDDGKGGFTKYDFTCGDGTIWDQEILACNHETSDKNCKSTGSTSTTSASEIGSTEISATSQKPNSETTRSPDVTSTSSDKCESEGFYANSNDCKKFYRCVSNGKGGYTKYDFSCGEGTVWVQEIQACDYDNDISNCSSKNNSSATQTTQEQQSTTTEFTSTGTSDSQSQPPQKEDDEYPSNDSSKSLAESDKCESEGFFANKNDCTRFYRCVDNGQGGYTKYDFTCGEGTAWDSDLQTCNHINEVESCQNMNGQNKPSNNEESSQNTSTTKDDTSTESSKPSNSDKCENDGYFGDTKDCTKFYRCVDNGKGGLTKYDFTCGEGTIWDQDITTCNHPQDVANPSCSDSDNTQSTSDNSSSTGDSGTSSSSTTQNSQNTTESSGGTSDCSQESTSKKPPNQKVKCEKAGFYPDPDDCKKFYRCVDWDGDGQKFSVFHFDCGEGTIWDPQLDTCNHEDSVYPPRDCSGTQSQNMTQESTTTEQSTTTQDKSTTESTTTTTEESTTAEQTSSSEQTSTTEKTSTTTQQSSSEQTTQQSSTTTEQSTTEQQEQTTQESTTSQQTTQQSTSSEQTTTQQTTTEKSTTQESTTSEQTTTQQSTTTEQTTTQQTTTNEQTTSQQSTTSSELTTQQTSSSEQTTQQTSNTDETTESTTTTTTEQSTTESTTEQENSTTESSSTTSTTTESSTTTTTEGSTATTADSSTTTSESSEGTTTEGDQGTTEQETSSSEKECPETDDDQYMYVCPTSFRRHPKYCNMFYQCTEDDDSHEVKVANFKCPNNTIYDESKTQCVEEDKADKKCDGQIARKYRVKRRNTNYKEPIEVGSYKHTCTVEGNYPFEKDIECSGAFLKCQKTKSGKLRGYVHRCPDGYTYWSISKRCEKKENMKDCKQSVNIWRDRWEIPMERKNIAK